MDSKRTYNYQTKLFWIVNVFYWMLVFVFVTIQYSREREYKVGVLDAKLQAYNQVILREYRENGNFNDKLLNSYFHDESVRVTVIDHSGNVLFDNSVDSLANHRDRREFVGALRDGHSYTIRRLSQSNNQEYFYSATAGNNVVVRTALPYDVNLANILKGELEYIWVVIGIAAIINIILYFAIGRIGSEVKKLQTFAELAATGNIDDYDVSVFSDDELGQVSKMIVKMYLDLKRISVERDKSMAEAIFEEKEKIRIKHQLTSNINHELKTPVQAISGCFETVLNNNLNEETRTRLLQTGYANALRLTNLLGDVTLITRITDDRESLPMTEVDINEVINNIRAEVDGYGIDKKMRINVDMPESVIVKGNRQLIDAIFRNLVNNAVAYSGGRDIFIAVTDEDEFYKFDFYDNGTGVEPQHLPQIFERFYRIDTGRSRKNGGTGLGLSIVRNAVAFHGGEIEARNRRFAGLEFLFSLHK